MKQCGQAEAKENGGCWREAGDRGEVWTAGGRKGRGREHRKGTEEGCRENRGRLGGERLEKGKRRKGGT